MNEELKRNLAECRDELDHWLISVRAEEKDTTKWDQRRLVVFQAYVIVDRVLRDEAPEIIPQPAINALAWTMAELESHDLSAWPGLRRAILFYQKAIFGDGPGEPESPFETATMRVRPSSVTIDATVTEPGKAVSTFGTGLEFEVPLDYEVGTSLKCHPPTTLWRSERSDTKTRPPMQGNSVNVS